MTRAKANWKVASGAAFWVDEQTIAFHADAPAKADGPRVRWGAISPRSLGQFAFKMQGAALNRT